jgi:hypothetical protein
MPIMLEAGWIPFGELAVSTNIPGWIKAHHQILEYPYKHHLSGQACNGLLPPRGAGCEPDLATGNIDI